MKCSGGDVYTGMASEPGMSSHRAQGAKVTGRMYCYGFIPRDGRREVILEKEHISSYVGRSQRKGYEYVMEEVT